MNALRITSSQGQGSEEALVASLSAVILGPKYIGEVEVDVDETARLCKGVSRGEEIKVDESSVSYEGILNKFIRSSVRQFANGGEEGGKGLGNSVMVDQSIAASSHRYGLHCYKLSIALSPCQF